MGIISEEGAPVRRPPAAHLILYAGRDHGLPGRLDRALADTHTSHCPGAGDEVVRFARALPHRERLPALVLPPSGADFDGLVAEVARLLVLPDGGR